METNVNSKTRLTLKDRVKYWTARPLEGHKLQSTETLLTQTLGVKKASRFRLGETAKAWIALIPALIFLILFMIYPILNSFIMSFIVNFSWQRGTGTSFAISHFIAALSSDRIVGGLPYIGFDNFIKLWSDPIFIDALENTVLMVIVSVPLTIIIGLLLAVAIYSIKPLQGFFQTVFFLPYVTNTIALGMVFAIIFGDTGLFNTVFHLGDLQWITDGADRWNMFFVIVVYAIWNGLAFKILVFMSGLASIDKQYYDAAKIDGASRATIFRRITVPLLSPQILYITITSFIGAFKSYTQIISLFGGGATNFGGTNDMEWITVVGYIYRFMTEKVDYAAAGSVTLLLIILLITLVQMAVSKKRVHY